MTNKKHGKYSILHINQSISDRKSLKTCITLLKILLFLLNVIETNKIRHKSTLDRIPKLFCRTQQVFHRLSFLDGSHTNGEHGQHYQDR